MSEFIVVVEDDPVLGPSLAQRLVLEGFAVSHASTLAEARTILGKRTPDFVLSDIRLPDGSGAELLDDLSERVGAVPVMFMTAFGDIDQAVDLVRRGARDYLSKPFDLDLLVGRIKELTLAGSGPEWNRQNGPFGLSPATKQLRSMLDRLAGIDLPVLLVGETGTGKEVAARYLHEAGNRASEPFEAVNCGQVSPDLADSVFFGHERGAFTGAIDKRTGALEAVGQGTLLLDEIGETPHDLQLKLLRVLQERSFRRLGARSDTPFAGRIVAATNRDLDEAIASGAFRQDLLYRINAVTLRIPPLRERREEIAPLLETFVAEICQRLSMPPKPVSDEALELAQSHDWPGNIRELRNRAERAVALSDAPVLSAADLFPDLDTATTLLPADGSGSVAPGAGLLTLQEARDAAERAHILAALENFGGRMRETAQALDISRSTLWERMRKHGLERPKD